MTEHTINIAVEFWPDGTPMAAYIQLRPGRVVTTNEVKRDLLLTDHDSQGRIVGIEMLGPVRVNIVLKAVGKSAPPAFRKLLNKNLPKGWLRAA